MTKNKGRFKPGQSGNPSGRPKGSKGFAAKIKERTNDLQELLDIALEMLRDTKTGKREKIQILNFLADRAVGKPTQQVDVDKQINIKLEIPKDIEEEI